MRRWSLWCLLGAMTAVAASVSGARANGITCGIARAQVVNETRTAVVVRQKIRGAFGYRYYGCLRSTSRPVLVVREYTRDGSTYELYTDRGLRLRGRYAAVAITACLGGCEVIEIAVWDLQTGVRLRLVDPKGPETYSLLLSRFGALAYVAGTGNRVLVAKADAAGHVVVKRGRDRDLPTSSVRIRGDRLSWRFKGERQSVRLAR